MSKNTIILLGILLLLAGVAFLVLQRPGEQSLSESGSSKFLDIDSASVEAITIESGAKTIGLTKDKGEWIIDGPARHRADQVAVGALVRQAEDLSVKSVISSKPDKHAMFQVDGSGTRLVLRTEGGDSVACLLGRTGPGFGDLYARLEGSNDVVLIDAAISYSLNKETKDWRDRTITSFPRDQIRQVDFAFGDTTFSLLWTDSAWTITGQPVKDWIVNSLVTSLSDFDADGFLDAPPSPLPRTVATITVAGTTIRFHRQPNSEKYLVKTSASSQWYEVEPWRANQLLKRKKELLAEN